jgi:anti-sigma B factor antagonist
MEFEARVEDGVKVISIAGHLETSCVNQFKDMFFDEVEADNQVILDCFKLDYLDSSGLAVLVNMYKNLNVRNVKLVMCGLPEGILRVIELTKLDRVFEISETLPDALAKVKS